MGLSLHHLKFENDNYFFSLFFRWFNQLSFLFHHSLSPSLSISVSLSAYISISSYVCLFLCIHMNNTYYIYILYRYVYVSLHLSSSLFFFWLSIPLFFLLFLEFFTPSGPPSLPTVNHRTSGPGSGAASQKNSYR